MAAHTCLYGQATPGRRHSAAAASHIGLPSDQKGQAETLTLWPRQPRQAWWLWLAMLRR